MAFSTAADLINDAAVELGLRAADLADPYDSTDPNIIQLCRLAKRVGRQLVRAHSWSHLQKEHTFSTVNGTASYALPADYDRLADQTGWNRTDQAPMYGPLTGAEWQRRKASGVTSIYGSFRIRANLIYFDPTPTAAESHAFEYVSSYWVAVNGASVPTLAVPTDGAHVVWFDPLLFTTGLRLSFTRAKGIDSTAPQQDFNDAFAAAVGADGAAPILMLGGPSWAERFLYGVSIPEGNWGL